VPVTFGTDHVVTLDYFSTWAVKNGTLSQRIKEDFCIETDPKWSLWNGGVFHYTIKAVKLLWIVGIT
jgi:hypothetical protein